jgi:2,3-bisphosphoglycerate-independent phosphoglycerate mutase
MKPIVLCILDGWGEAPHNKDNAIALAHTPCWDMFLKEFPHTTLEASANAVGLPTGQMGNSEVGHMTIGAGRVVYQDLPRIDRAIHEGSLVTNPALLSFMETVISQGTGVCHLLGLMSPGGVHSHQAHLFVLSQLLAQQGIQVYVHAFLDGRDTPPKSALGYVESFLKEIVHIPTITLASIGGRYYGMDRDNRWERIEQAYNAIVLANAPTFDDPLAYINACYQEGKTDEFIPPAIRQGYPGVRAGDGLLEGNFRADRVRQFLTALLDPEFKEFQRHSIPQFSTVAGMTKYSESLAQKMLTLFGSQPMSQSLGEVVSQAALKQLRIAETEKYAHVTFFFNGGREKPFPGEDRILVPSPKVATYDLQPEMSAGEITDNLLEAIRKGTHDVIIVNYANTDMVGHSGNLDATIKAVEFIDQCLGRLYEAVREKGGVLLITADHGNAETMIDGETTEQHTAHTTNPVPFLLISNKFKKYQLRSGGGLLDIAPTILEMMQLPLPHQMTGDSLINKGYSTKNL